MGVTSISTTWWLRRRRGPRDTGDCLWTTWKASPAAKGARRLRWPATWNARGRCASTSAGAIRSPVMLCARRCVERAAFEFCEESLGIPGARLIAERSLDWHVGTPQCLVARELTPVEFRPVKAHKNLTLGGGS